MESIHLIEPEPTFTNCRAFLVIKRLGFGNFSPVNLYWRKEIAEHVADTLNQENFTSDYSVKEMEIYE